ncbi:MAG: class I SAM-dependent methyltransferase [Thermoguttaceae bacterium]
MKLNTMNTLESRSVSGATYSDSALAEENKVAWDRLYASTDDLVWGDRDLPFVTSALERLRREGVVTDGAYLLDAATGEGRNVPALLRSGGNVTACDASPAALAKLAGRFGECVTTVECDLALMPFESFKFDVVLACDIIETLPNLEEVLTEIGRVLRVGGVLIANVPDFDDGISSEAMLPIESGNFMYQGSYFFRFQSESDFVAAMRRCGLELWSSHVETWWEDPHPGYRDGVHSHTSRIIIATRQLDS